MRTASLALAAALSAAVVLARAPAACAQGDAPRPGAGAAEQTLGPGYRQRFGRGLLLAKLSSPNPQWRIEAAQELGRRRDEGAVPALIEMIEGPAIGANAAATEAIVQALGQIGDRRAVPALLQLLSARGPVQRAAIRALGRIGDERALDPIAALLSRPSLAREAIDALLRLGPRVLMRVVSLLRDPSTAGPACELLSRLGDRRATWPMVRALNSPRARVRRTCAGALGRLGDSRAQRALFGLLQDPDATVRRRALSALLRIADGSMGPLLAPMLGEEERGPLVLPALRSRSARAAIPAISEIARGEPGPRQVEAIAALGRIGGSEAVEALAPLLRSERAATRFHAAAALASLGMEQGLEPLRSAASGDAPERVEALVGLARLLRSAPVVRADPTPPRELREMARQALADPSPEVVGAGILLAAALRDRRSLPRLAALLRQGPRPELRALAAAGLGRLESSAACPPIIAAIGDENEGVRAAAAWSAGELACRQAGPRLIELVERGPDGAAGNAAWALGAIAESRAAHALRRRLDEGGPALRANAALALAALGDRRAGAVIRRRLRFEQSPRVRAAFVDALGRLGDPASLRALRRVAEAEDITGDIARDAIEAIEHGRRLVAPRGVSIFHTRVVDGSGNPLSNLWYTVALPDRRMRGGLTGPSGDVFVAGLPEGTCHLGLGMSP